jgi:hypothetical protein
MLELSLVTRGGLASKASAVRQHPNSRMDDSVLRLDPSNRSIQLPGRGWDALNLIIRGSVGG